MAQSDLGLDGTGIKVGVMDTGVDYDNPALGGCFGAGCRVATGWTSSATASTRAAPAARDPHPDTDPDDCYGHGTHVAGIVGANGTVNGVADQGRRARRDLRRLPRLRLRGLDDRGHHDRRHGASDQADGMDIVNMSIGDAFAWDTDRSPRR